MRSPCILILLGALSACNTNAPFITPLDAAARQGDVEAIRVLAAHGADLNAPDRGGTRWTPLLHAIHKNRLASVEALIAAGADVNRASPGGLSPLEMAAGNGDARIVTRLLDAGANPREPGVFAAAVSGGAVSDIDRPLLGRCNTEVVRALLQRAPDLRLPRNARGHVSYLFARLKDCEAVIEVTQFASK
jgi:ankyrin repeat protein